MTRPSSRAMTTATIPAVLLLAMACERAPAGWSPVLERTSTAFLERPVDEAAEGVERARSALPEDQQTASEELARAARALEDLRSYYLPLLEAREGSYNAYRYLLLDDQTHAREELDRVEGVLLAVARSDRRQVVAEMTTALRELEEARIALGTGDTETAALIERLAAHLDQLALKGELVLEES